MTKPVYRHVAENLYRREPSGTYYAVLKRDGKQICKSLNSHDRKLADRRLSEFVGQAANLRPQDESRISFEALAAQWLDTQRHTITPSTAEPRVPVRWSRRVRPLRPDALSPPAGPSV